MPLPAPVAVLVPVPASAFLSAEWRQQRSRGEVSEADVRLPLESLSQSKSPPRRDLFKTQRTQMQLTPQGPRDLTPGPSQSVSLYPSLESEAELPESHTQATPPRSPLSLHQQHSLPLHHISNNRGSSKSQAEAAALG